MGGFRYVIVNNLHKGDKKGNSNGIAIPKSQPSQPHHTEAPEIQRIESSNKKMATENGLYNNIVCNNTRCG